MPGASFCTGEETRPRRRSTESSSSGGACDGTVLTCVGISENEGSAKVLVEQVMNQERADEGPQSNAAIRRYVEIALLALVGGWAYFANLHLSLLEGSEGLYAGIAGEMGRRREFFDLTYHDVPYFNKPPLFFWLLNLSTSIWGDHEIALRLPGSLAAVGTIILTYVLGVRLVSPAAGFWAALVVATSHVFLWYGRRVLFDSTLTFLVTLALFAWIHVQLLGRSSRWYLLAFISMALGAMLKEMHGFFLPLLVMALYAAIQRDTRMLKDGYFWAGLALAVALMAGYAQMLGPGYQHHFRIGKAIESTWNTGFIGKPGPATDGHPLYWYLGMMWADFFPWCAVLPSALLLLWAQRPFRAHSTELLLLVWVLGLFTAFSLATLKREPYLTTVVPGIGLMIGYYYHRVFASAEASASITPPAPHVAGCVGRDVRRRDVLRRSTPSSPLVGVHCRSVADVHRDDRLIGRCTALCRGQIARTVCAHHGRRACDRIHGTGGELRVSRDRSGRIAPEGRGGNQNPGSGHSARPVYVHPGVAEE
jgi:hypothetical protein